MCVNKGVKMYLHKECEAVLRELSRFARPEAFRDFNCLINSISCSKQSIEIIVCDQSSCFVTRVWKLMNEGHSPSAREAKPTGQDRNCRRLRVRTVYVSHHKRYQRNDVNGADISCLALPLAHFKM